MRKVLSLLLIVTLLVAGGSQIHKASPVQAREDTTITVWGFVWTADWLDTIASGFEEAHPGVKVKVERFEYEAYRDAIVTTLASGGGVPDVVTLDPMWAGDLIRDGALSPLDGIEEQINPADFVAGGWQLCQDGGVQYGVPADLDFNLIFYRKDIYDPAIAAAGLDGFPTNAEDFIKVAQAISNDDQKAILLAEADYYGWYQGFLAPYGGRLVSEDGSKYAFNSDAGVEALKMYGDLVNEYNVALPWDDLVDGDPMVALKNGDALAIMHGSWYVTELASAAPEMQGQWAVAPMPFGPADRTVHAATGGSCFSVPVSAEQQDLGREFLAYLEQPEVMATYYAVVGGVPSLKTAWDFIDLEGIDDYLGVPLAREVADWSANVSGMELPSSELTDALGEAIYGVTMDGADPADALDEAEAACPPLD